jgi:hypothetical protein
MQARRAIVLIISALVGAAVTLFIVYARIPLGPITLGFGTDLQRFAYSNVALLFLSVAAVVGIWLDYFLNTGMLKS